MGLFKRNKPQPPNAVVVDGHGEELAVATVVRAVSPTVQIYNALSAFPQFGTVASISLRPDEEGEVGIVAMSDGEEFYVHFTHTNRSTAIHVSDGHDDVTIHVS